MGCIRPATPGFLVTLAATALLAVVSFCVPYFRSVYFLKASIDLPNNQTGSITFGTLGYCVEFPTNGTTCSKPSIGYQLDINALVGNNLPIEIPQVAVKWITYALFLHVVALILSAGSAAFGLLAHIREMSMTCCSTCVSGFAASVALIAFIFDLVLFFVARARINAVGSASIGNAIWLTLAAWVLLFFSGCFYCLGRCCVSRRPRNGGTGWGEGTGKDPRYEPPPKNEYAEQVRLDAVKAEADRKARAKQQEVGLPAFSETQPLTARVDGDHVYLDDDTESKAGTSSAPGSLAGRKPSQNTLNSNHRPAYAAGGYVQGAAGHRAMDEYYNPTSPPMPNSAPNTYPPQPHRQGSSHTYNPSAYDPNQPYGAPQRQGSAGPPGLGGYGGYQTTSPPPQQMLNVPGQYNDPYSPQAYGHTQGGSSYHTASAHSQHPSAVAYSPYEQGYDQPQTGVAYSTPPPPQQQQQTEYFSPQPNSYYTNEPPSFLAPGLAAQSTSPPPIGGYGQQPSPYEQTYAGTGGGYDQQQRQPTRQYTLGGDGYGQSSVPPLQDDHTGAGGAAYDPYGGVAMVGSSAGNTSPVKGPRAQPPPVSSNPYIGGAPEESPPGYDQGDGQVQGRWGKQ